MKNIKNEFNHIDINIHNKYSFSLFFAVHCYYDYIFESNIRTS